MKEKKLSDDLFEVKFKDHVGLFPSQLADPKKSVEDLLKAAIGKRHRAGGYLVGFRNVRFSSSLGSLYRESPFIHVDFSVKLRVFRPQAGGVYGGIVVQGGVATIHAIFPVTLSDNQQHLAETAEGQEQTLRVKLQDEEIKERRGAPHLFGSLV